MLHDFALPLKSLQKEIQDMSNCGICKTKIGNEGNILIKCVLYYILLYFKAAVLMWWEKDSLNLKRSVIKMN